MRKLIIGLVVCGGLAGCVGPPFGAPPVGAPPFGFPPAGNLQSARQACNGAYPPRIGNYLPHAQCVNAAVEQFALPTDRHPDLIRLQEQARAVLSERVDRRAISVGTGERKMTEADTLVAEAERERDAGHAEAADRRVARIEALLRE